MAAMFERLNALSRGGAAVLADAGVKSAVVLLAAAIAATFLRQAPAAVRHRVWSLALCGALVMPLLSWMLPQLRLPVLPANAETALAGEPGGVPPTRPENAAAWARDANLGTTAIRSASLPGQPLDAAGAAANPIRAEDFAAAQAAPPDAQFYVLGVWIAGLAMVLAPLVVGLGTNWLLLRASRRLTEARCLRWIAELSARIGLRRTVTAFESPLPVVPMTWGLLRPMVLVPADWRDWPEERQRCVLLHELAHVKRLDVLFQTIGRLAAALYWFNPLVWFAVRQLRIERELACDDCVLASGERASDYARELLRIAKLYRLRPLAVGVAMAHSARLEQRVLRILDQACSRLPMSRRAARCTSVAAAALVLGIAATSLVERSTSAVEGQDEPARQAKGDDAFVPPPAVVERDVVSHTSNHVNAVAVSSDGRLVAGSGMDRLVRIWKLDGGALVHQLADSQRIVRAVAFQPRGSLLASAGDEAVVRVWDVEAGAQVKTLDGLNPTVKSLSFSPDGRLLAGCSFKQKGPKQWQGDVVVWDVDASERVRVVETQANGYYRGVAFSPDGSLLAAAFDSAGSSRSSGVKLWDTKTWELKRTLLRDRGGSVSVAFSPDGRHVASGGGYVEIVDGRMATGEVKIWDVKSANLVGTLARPAGGGYVAIAYSPLGSIAGQGFGPVVETARGSHIVSEITNWNPATEQFTWNVTDAFCGEPTPPAFTPDGTKLITCDTEAVRVLGAESGDTLRVLMKAERLPVDAKAENGAPDTTSNTEADDEAKGAAAQEPKGDKANDVSRGKVAARGVVVTPDGEPAAGARVYALDVVSSSYLGGETVHVLAETVTASDGAFSLIYREPEKTDQGGVNQFARIHRTTQFVATADGYALGLRSDDGGDRGETIRIQLAPAEALVGRLIDLEGRPLAGAAIHVKAIAQAGEPLDRWFTRAKGNLRPDEQIKLLSSSEPQPRPITFPLKEQVSLAAMPLVPTATTDRDGHFSIANIGADRLVVLEIISPNVAMTIAKMVSHRGPDVYDAFPDPRLHDRMIHGAGATIVVGPATAVKGVVADAETGRPIANCRVAVTQVPGSPMTAEDFADTITDEAGRYVLGRLPPDQPDSSGYRLRFTPPVGAAYFPTEFQVRMGGDAFETAFDARLPRARVISGRVTDHATGQPVRALVGYLPTLDNKAASAYSNFQPGMRTVAYRDFRWNEADGSFHVPAISGRGVLCVTAERMAAYALAGHADRIEGLQGQEGTLGVYHLWSAAMCNELREVNLAEGDSDPTIDVALRSLSRRAVRLLDGQGRFVVGCLATGQMPDIPLAGRYNMSYYPPLESAETEVVGLEVESPRVLAFRLPTQDLGAIAVARHEDQEPITITLRQCGQIVGRVLDATGKPAADRQVFASGLPPVEMPQLKHAARPASFHVFTDTVKTDAGGQFKIRGVLPGLRYEVAVREGVISPDQPGGDQRAVTPSKKHTSLIEPGQTVHVGDLGVASPNVK